jgi:glycosyltransferase involved in cell wall biosynthesis
MKVAFYAPLKTPDSPVPSGDRLIARMLWQAIEAGGHRVELVSRFRSFDKHGNGDRQLRLARIGAWTAQRLIRKLRDRENRPDLWLTYHLYHKAPDYLGPVVTSALGIPYCVAEASSSPRQAEGRWKIGYAASTGALATADLIINLNPKDEPEISELVGPQTRMMKLQPFIDGRVLQAARSNRENHRATLARGLGLDPAVPWLLSVAMMRHGDKAASYTLLADALDRLQDRSWQLVIAGDGPARGELEKRYAAFGSRVRLAGQQSPEAVAALMAASDLLVWPAINEAIGMVFIEAAMAGLPVVGADRPGIAAVVEHGQTGLLVPEHDIPAFAADVDLLLSDKQRRIAMGQAAAVRAGIQNEVTQAGPLLCRQLEALVG